MSPTPRGLDDSDQPVFWVWIDRGPNPVGVWWIVRVSGLAEPKVDDFRALLRGGPSPLRIEESGWVGRGEALRHYTPKGRVQP
jgi:hypothetical protein